MHWACNSSIPSLWEGSVADPDPAQYVFGPSGAGSISKRYESESFHHQAKKVGKTLIPNVL
jgi:hypothetical protein